MTKLWQLMRSRDTKNLNLDKDLGNFVQNETNGLE